MKTIKLQGREYVQVAERLRAVHKDYADFDIETEYKVTESGGVVFTAKLTIRDAKKVRVFMGHSFGKLGASKQFEKQETIAVGRALAFAGYHADGEIASADEMQEHAGEIDQEALADALSQLNAAKNVKELNAAYKKLPLELQRNKEVIQAGKDKKKALTTIE